jgi:hypothetical protein
VPQSVAQRLALEAAAENRLLFWPKLGHRGGQYWERTHSHERGRLVARNTVRVLADAGLIALPAVGDHDDSPMPVPLTPEGARRLEQAPRSRVVAHRWPARGGPG